MVLTPLDLEKGKEFRKSARGYNIKEVEDYLTRVFKDYEEIYRQNLELQEELAEVKEKLNQYKLLEDTLQNALVLAQQTAEKTKKAAEEERKLIIDKAKLQKEKIIQAAEAKADEIRGEYERLRQLEINYKTQLKTFFQTQLAILEEGATEDAKALEEVAASKAED